MESEYNVLLIVLLLGSLGVLPTHSSISWSTVNFRDCPPPSIERRRETRVKNPESDYKLLQWKALSGFRGVILENSGCSVDSAFMISLSGFSGGLEASPAVVSVRLLYAGHGKFGRELNTEYQQASIVLSFKHFNNEEMTVKLLKCVVKLQLINKLNALKLLTNMIILLHTGSDGLCHDNLN